MQKQGESRNRVGKSAAPGHLANLQSIALPASSSTYIVYDSCIVTTPTDTTRQIRFVRASLRDTTRTADTLRAVRVDTAVSVTYDPKPIASKVLKNGSLRRR